MGIVLGRRSDDFVGEPILWSVMLVRLAVWWSVNLGRMKSGHTGQVLARQHVLAIRSGWDGLWVIRIACHATSVVNSGAEFVLREGGALRLIK